MAAFNVSRDHSGDAWFRIGRLDVTSTMLLVLLGAIGVVLSAFAPGLVNAGAFVPGRVITGEAWRVVTWAFVEQISLWSVLTLVLLWYFGTDLERQVGRTSMASLYAGMWITLTITTFVLGIVFAPEQRLFGLNGIQFLVLLLWIAENPRRPFFFGIPAWAIGAVLVAVQILGFIASRDISGLLSLIISFAICAGLAKRAGLFSGASWIPTARPSAKAPRGARPPKVSRSAQREEQRRMSDSDRLDQLLEKISAEGIHSLSASERKELERLRQRRKAR
ncbi:MAG: rhomboid family intramembrane serine protease [Actinomycetes bacterium]